jgi:hypothetical protein
MGAVIEHGLTGETRQVHPDNSSGTGPKTDGTEGRANKAHAGKVKPSPVAPTDDEILGISGHGKPDSTASQLGFDWEDSDPTPPAAGDDGPPAGEPASRAGLDAALGANPELKRAWEDVQAYRESFRTPAEARTATAALADLDRIDSLFFSNRPKDHAELARVVASLDPSAFRSLARAMSEVAKEGARAPSDHAHSEGAAATTKGPAASKTEAGRNANPRAEAAPSQASSFAPGADRGLSPAQEGFFHSTNAAAVGAVIEAIESQVGRLLPEEISKGARNRLVGEIYRELDASLRSDRQFARQAREAFRSGPLDDEHQRAIVSLVSTRARQSLPGVARRVLNEWTSAIVAANQDRRARQRAAERRVDIDGSGRSGNDGQHPVTPKDINYARMSDADILNL